MNKKFTLSLVVFSAIIAMLGVLFQFLYPKYASPTIPFIVVFFFCITFFSLGFVFQTKDNKKFIFNYMLSRIVKIIAILLFLILYFVFNSEDRWNFAIAFLIIYFSFLIFEIIALIRNNETSL